MLRNNKMTEDTVSIRLATIEDVNSITELHYESFTSEDHIPMILGKRYVKATYKWHVGSKNAYTLVAEIDGKLVGFMAACKGGYTLRMFVACFYEFVLCLMKNPMLLINMKLWKRLFRRPMSRKGQKKITDHPGFGQLTIGAVKSGFRGQGIYPALVEAHRSVGRVRGIRVLSAGIYKKNHSARRVFVKGGWTETPELETSDTVFYIAYLDPFIIDELGMHQVTRSGSV
jgi:ribosomal protein S18 acetylase RimI-like enzyme